MADIWSEDLTIRPALDRDRDGMLRITKDVWDGTDYVPFVWYKWLEDRSGFLAVATWDARVVGLQHIDLQSDGCAWLEGIRVDETMQGRGIGAAMLSHGLDWARSAGCSVVRLSTSSGNESSTRIARKAGLREVGRFDVLTGPSAGDSIPSLHVRLADAGDLKQLYRMLLRPRHETQTAAFYTEGWTAYCLNAERLNMLVATHAVTIAEMTEIVAVGIATASVGRPILRLGYLDGSIQGMTAVATWMQAQAAAAAVERVRAIIPSGAVARDVLHSLGFSSSADFSMVLWEIGL